ncbi:MAG: hypothetical protein N3D20_01065 [Candidatus Pacearchaeota archaeon]|nr:hypothetical protein [Candidatus Pacearchaeota archaeon]
MQKKVKIKVKEIKSKIKIKEIKQEKEETLEEQLENIPSRIHLPHNTNVPVLEMEHFQPAKTETQLQKSQKQEQEIISYETRKTSPLITERRNESSERIAPILKKESQFFAQTSSQPLLQEKRILGEEISERKYELEEKEKPKTKHKYPWEA